MKEYNFCRVFEMPDKYPSDYCFMGGHRVNIQMVDWFEPLQPHEPIPKTMKQWARHEADLDKFIRSKKYFRKGRTYLLMTEFGYSMVIK